MVYNKEDFGERIKRRRHLKNYTQEQLAELINTSKNTISNIERGETSPSIEVLVEICNVLGFDPNYYILGQIPNEEIEKYNSSLLKLSSTERTFFQNFLDYYGENKK